MADRALKVLVLAEVAGRRPIAPAYEALGLARALADSTRGVVEACAVGTGLERVGEDLVAHGADRAYVVDAPATAHAGAEAWLPDAVAVASRAAPDAVIVAHTDIGAALAPRLAFRVQSAAVTACVDVRVSDAGLHLTRPCYGGKAHEVVSIRTKPAIFTIKAKSFEAATAQPDRRGEIVALRSTRDETSLRVKIRETRRDPDEDAALENAQIVVAGGGGMKGAQGFDLARRLAEVLGGAVGASRVACDLGWCPPSYQVGLSGKTIAPQLYLAIGISGAGQHMAGCGRAKNIVAINTDRDAPIFRFARYGIVADCHEMMPALIEKLSARLSLDEK